jgi:ABC-type lipoprotein release transport system permease subunit
MPCRSIVGIVGDSRVSGSVDSPYDPVFYIPLTQGTAYRQTPHLFFLPRGDAATARSVVRRVLQELEPGLPAVSVHAVKNNFSSLTAQLALGAAAFTAFGVLAAIVAAIGLYSVLSFLVVEQRRETAIRLALGAQPGALGLSMARRSVAIVVGGMLIGFAALIPLARVLEPLLFHSRLLDASSLVVVTSLGAVTALVGALVPIRSILKTNAIAVLRE